MVEFGKACKEENIIMDFYVQERSNEKWPPQSKPVQESWATVWTLSEDTRYRIIWKHSKHTTKYLKHIKKKDSHNEYLLNWM